MESCVSEAASEHTERPVRSLADLGTRLSAGKRDKIECMVVANTIGYTCGMPLNSLNRSEACSICSPQSLQGHLAWQTALYQTLMRPKLCNRVMLTCSPAYTAAVYSCMSTQLEFIRSPRCQRAYMVHFSLIDTFSQLGHSKRLQKA